MDWHFIHDPVGMYSLKSTVYWKKGNRVKIFSILIGVFTSYTYYDFARIKTIPSKMDEAKNNMIYEHTDRASDDEDNNSSGTYNCYLVFKKCASTFV